MIETPVVWFAVTLMAFCLLVVFVPTFNRNGMQSRRVRSRKSSRQGDVTKLAGLVVLSLGRLAIAILHMFEKLGVEMSTFDEALARLTTFTTAQAETVKAAKKTIEDQHAQIDKMVADNAAQEQIDIANAVKAALADAAAQLDGVTNSLQNPPVDPPAADPTPPAATDPGAVVVTDPGPPQTPPSGSFPTSDVPVVPAGDPANVPDQSIPTPTPVAPVDTPPVAAPPADVPVVVSPGSDPVPAGDLPAATPVVAAPDGPVAEVPSGTPVASAGDLPADAPVVEVTPPPVN